MSSEGICLTYIYTAKIIQNNNSKRAYNYCHISTCYQTQKTVLKINKLPNIAYDCSTKIADYKTDL